MITDSEKIVALETENAKLRGWCCDHQRAAWILRGELHKVKEERQGYYNEASDGWTKFRECERKLTAHQEAGRQPHMRP